MPRFPWGLDWPRSPPTHTNISMFRKRNNRRGIPCKPLTVIDLKLIIDNCCNVVVHDIEVSFHFIRTQMASPDNSHGGIALRTFASRGFATRFLFVARVE